MTLKCNRGVCDKMFNKKATISCHDKLWLEGRTLLLVILKKKYTELNAYSDYDQCP